MAKKKPVREPVNHDNVLRETAEQQWHADAPSGATAKLQMEVTRRKLALIGLTPKSPQYVKAYEEAKGRLR
jgi:hypothetical protein